MPLTSPLARRRLPDDAWEQRRALKWVLFFVAFQIACQLALLRPEFQSLRALVRGASFGINLLLLVIVTGRTHIDLLGKLLLTIVIVLSLGIFHPSTPSIIVAVAVVGFYFSVFASTFWVSRLKIDLNSLRVLMIAFWSFHALSAGVGVLQTLFPGQFQGSLSAVVESSTYGGQNLFIELDNGARIYRPMGLTDTPGGAAISGMYVCLLGMALLLDRRYRWWGLIFAAGMMAGLYCLLICQVRVFVVALFICTLAFATVLSLRGESPRVVKLMAWLALTIFFATIAAMSVGSDAVISRVSTLVASDPLSVYRGNRGLFLEYTFRFAIFEYPLGAGLGRWGMVNAYVGNPADSLWSEINWTAWCYDGGIVLMGLFAFTLIYMILRAYKITGGRLSREWRVWGAMLVSYNLAFFAINFCANPVLSQIGVEFFMINAVVYTAWLQDKSHVQTPPQPNGGRRPGRVRTFPSLALPHRKRASSIPRA